MNAEDLYTDWQVPPFVASAESRMAYIEESIQESEGWLSGQKCYRDLAANMRVFDAIFSDKTKSTLVSNGLKYDCRKFISKLSQVREIGTYGADAPQWKPYAEMENRMSQYIYLKSQFPMQIKKALQYAVVTGVGYLWPKCKTQDYGYGDREVVFEAGGLLDVMPLQLDSSNDVQSAYINHIYEYYPIAEAHGRFPAYQSSLQPVAKQKYSSKVQARRLAYAELNRYGMSDAQRNWGNLYAEIRFSFIRDVSINRYGVTLPMGDPGTSWYYEVPYIGQPILGGIRNGLPFMRPARPEDCRIYPYLRLIISSYGMTTPMYDGPAFDWHGKMPAVQYNVESWPWEPTGRSLVGDVASIETTIRKLERKMDSVVTVTLNPPMGYDRGATGGPKIENFDLFEEDVRLGVDGDPDAILRSILPDSVSVKPEHFQFLEYLVALRGKQTGLEDSGNLDDVKFNIASDDAEKFLDAIGPIGIDIAMMMEAANAKIADMVKFMIPQWYDTAMIVSIIGASNTPQEVFDFDPNSMIPSHMPEEMIPYLMDPTKPPVYRVPNGISNYSQIDRARRFAKNVRLISIPSTLLKVTQMQEQLKYLQLQQKGFPISNHTVAKKLNLENYGEIEGTTEWEKWVNEQKLMLGIKAALAQMAAQLMPQPPEEEGGGEAPPPAPGPGKGSAKAGGRPSTLAKAPRLEQKGKGEGAPRTTITNS